MPKKIRSEKRIKQDAKDIKKNSNVSHSEALNIAVREIGFPSYQAYKNALSKSTKSFISERILRNEIVKRGIDYAIFNPTETGLRKSIIDATAPVRNLFELEDFHYYKEQPQGDILRHFAYLWQPYLFIGTQVSLYRPKTKKGDPRMWFRHLKELAEPGDSIAIVFFQKRPYLINLSRIDDLSKFKSFINEIASSKSTIADELLSKLKILAKGEPLSTPTKGDTAVGMAIEQALGILPNSSKKPDYKGIEIKSSRRKVRTTRNTLFAQVADWSKSHLKSSRAILEKYGYQRGDEFKLYCTVSALKENSQGLQFKLEQGGDELHEIHEKDGKVAVWSAHKLRSRLAEKHAETFWVKAESRKIDGKEFFFLKSVIHTREPLKSQIIPLIEEGVITMDHLIKRNKSGRVSEKGPLFKISPSNLDLLFPAPIEYDLLGD